MSPKGTIPGQTEAAARERSDRASSPSPNSSHERALDSEKQAEPGQPRGPGPAESTHRAPDGGTAAWLVILGNWCTMFCSFGWVNSTSAIRMRFEGLQTLTVSAPRHRDLPGLLLNPAAGAVFQQRSFMDSFPPGLLHDGHGKPTNTLEQAGMAVADS